MTRAPPLTYGSGLCSPVLRCCLLLHKQLSGRALADLTDTLEHRVLVLSFEFSNTCHNSTRRKGGPRQYFGSTCRELEALNLSSYSAKSNNPRSISKTKEDFRLYILDPLISPFALYFRNLSIELNS